MNSHYCIHKNSFVRTHLPGTALICVLLLADCSTSTKTTKNETPGPSTPQPRLAITVKVGSIDLSNYGKRIEKKDIERFSATLKREQIEILAVQGISRYSNVKTRIDFVDELAAQTDMRRALGESIDMLGRELVNAVFSIYPIRSNQKQEFDVPSAFYESALQVSIDAGVRDVVVVSTRLPVRATGQDLAKCIQTIAGLQKTPDSPFIVTGNLPPLKKGRDPETFSDIQSSLPEGSGKLLSSHLWYAQGGLFKLLNARVAKSELGTLTVAEFGLYQSSLLP
jgi:hypothetical protein